MHKETFNNLKGDPKVYYIYNIGSCIFGFPKYIIVVADDWKSPIETDSLQSDDISIGVFKVSQ